MNFGPAFSYLQSLITQPEGFTNDGARDFGWCCSEHALVLSLALNLCGTAAIVSEGEVNISLPNEMPQLVFRHWFVAEDVTIFDSSIRFGAIKGIYPGVVLSTPVQFQRKITSHPRGHAISYIESAQHNPFDYIQVKSSTPYGKWLTSHSIQHPDFWKNASELTAKLLRNSIAIPAFTDRAAALTFTMSDSLQ